MRTGLMAVLALLVAGCGELRGVAPIGTGPRYRPAPAATASSGLGCADNPPRAWVHLELFARGKVMIVPAGIGIAPPYRRDGAYVRGGRCRYPLSTTEPTGLIAVARPGLTLGDLFAVWGRPLARDRLDGFRAPVTVHLDGRRWTGDPRAVPLRHHAQIVVQAGTPLVEPHASYRFPQ
jgi:hypothetical protein